MKKFLTILSLVIFLLNPIYANAISWSLEYDDPQVRQYVDAAEKTTDYKERQVNYKAAINAVDKTNLTVDNARLLAGLNYSYATEEAKNSKRVSAYKYYWTAYNYLKRKMVHKNDSLALACLIGALNTISTRADEVKVLKTIEATQMGLAEAYPQEFKYIHSMLAEYYSLAGNNVKAKRYKAKAGVNN